MTHPILTLAAIIAALILFRLIRRMYLLVRAIRSIRIRRES